MTDIEKEMLEAASKHANGFYSQEKTAHACYEIHRREMEKLKSDLGRFKKHQYLNEMVKEGLGIAIEQIRAHYLKEEQETKV
jgi:hypothetical protein